MNTKRFAKIITLLAAVIFGACMGAYAIPSSDEISVVSGDVQVEVSDNIMNVSVSGDKAIINMDSFSVGVDERVNFFGPDSELLARVTGGDPSIISGHIYSDLLLLALVNEAGITVTETGSIDARNLILSTRDITDSNFISSNYLFEKLSKEYQDLLLLNKGSIRIHDGGFGVLIAGAIENDGIISARAGKIVLAGGDGVRLDMSQDGLISVAITKEVASTIFDANGNPISDQLVNKGILKANGGQILLTAKSITSIFRNAINLEGYIEAERIGIEEGGLIKLLADEDIVINAEMRAHSINAESEKNVYVNMDIFTQGGDIVLTADSDKDGVGSFFQNAERIEASGAGNIEIDGSGEMKLNTVKVETGLIKVGTKVHPTAITGRPRFVQAVGDLGIQEVQEGEKIHVVKTERGDVLRYPAEEKVAFEAETGTITTLTEVQLPGTYIELVADSFKIESSAEVVHIVSNKEDITIESIEEISEKLAKIRGSGMGEVTYLKTKDITLESPRGTINTVPGVFIPGKQVKLIANKFGSVDNPVGINADITYINRLQGIIDVSEMWGMGSSITIRGPAPSEAESSWGALSYDSNTHLILEAEDGSIHIGPDSALFASSLTLISSDGIYSEGSLTAPDTISLTSLGPVYSYGSLETKYLIERGATFRIGGDFIVEESHIRNADGAVYLDTGNYQGLIADDGDIIIESGADITLVGDTTFWADYNQDGVEDGTGLPGGSSGNNGNGVAEFLMESGSSIDGGGYNLTLYTSADSTLRSIDNVNIFTIGSSDGGAYAYTCDASETFNVDTFKTLGDGTTIFSRTIGDGTSGNPIMIYDVTQLQAMQNDVTLNYKLANNIDASTTTGWNGGEGFVPVGTNVSPFTGDLDGDGKVISGLYINRSNTTDYVGLFGYLGALGQVENLGLVDVDITSTGTSAYVGTIAGYLNGNSAAIIESYATGNIETHFSGGGLAAVVKGGGIIMTSYARVNIDGANANCVGGLVGTLGSADGSGTIYYSYAAATSITSSNKKGGLVGEKILWMGFIDQIVLDSYFDKSILPGMDDENTNNFGSTIPFGQTTLTMMDSTQTGAGGIYQYWDFTQPGVWIMAGYPHLQMEHSTRIRDVYQLQMMVLDLSADYILINDIDASQTSQWNWNGSKYLGFEPVGDFFAGTYFTGELDGNGYSVKGLTIDRSNYLGLFSGLAGDVRNLGVVDVDITGGSGTGGLAGIATTGRIENCYTTGIVRGDMATGGLLGWSWTNAGPVVITNSYSTASVIGNRSVGGLVGDHDEFGLISNCYATGRVEGNDRVGGLIGSNFSGTTVTNSFATGEVVSAGIKGGLMGSSSLSATVTDCGWWKGNPLNPGLDAIGSPAGSVTYEPLDLYTSFYYSDYGIYSTWDIDFAAGHTWIMAGYPHLQTEHTTNITNAEQLQLMVLDPDGDYVLANNIDASQTSQWNWDGSQYLGFKPVGDEVNAFTGSLDGGGNTVTDLTINRPSEDYVALFGYIDGATPDQIQDVALIDADITGGTNIGGLVAYNTQSGVTGISGAYSNRVYNVIDLQLMNNKLNETYTIMNYIDASDTANWNYDDGLGRYLGFVPLGIFTGTIDGNDQTISNLYIDQTGFAARSGLLSYKSGGSVYDLTLENVDIKGSGESGGLAGASSGTTITNCRVTGKVSGGSYVGGLIGTGQGTFTNCSTDVEVTGGDYLGGLIGRMQASTISYSHADGPVTGTGTYAGGLVGYIVNCNINRSYATGRIESQRGVGGLVGFFDNPGTISASYATGDVIGTYTGSSTSYIYYGGLVGGAWEYSNLNITNCYAMGDVTASANGAKIGGLVGWFYGNVSNSYSTGHVSGTGSGQLIGGFVGTSPYPGSTHTNCYWDVTTSGTSVWGHGPNAAATGRITRDMKMQSNFSGWNFTITGVAPEDSGGVWIMTGYPHLQMEWSENPSNVYQLQMLALDLDFDYTLANNIDAAETNEWNWDGSKYLGFDPVGNYNNRFTGTLNGNDYTVDGLTINRPANPFPYRTGLFGMTGSGSHIENIGLTNIDITGGVFTGGLVGQNYEGTIVSSYTTGFLYAPSVWGYNDPFNTNRAGGFVGSNDNGVITNCYSEVTVEGNNYMGGFVGSNGNSSTITKCYSTGSVTANDYAGGFAGVNNGTISDSYAWGDVDAAYAAGGFAGENAGTIQNSYSIGAVDPPATSGGFIGVSYPGSSYTANFWNTETSGMTDGIGSGGPSSEVTGKITREMKRIETFNPGIPSGTSDWNFTVTGNGPEDGGGVWIMAGYPHLQMEWRANITNPIQLQLMQLEKRAGTNYNLMSNVNVSDTGGWNWDGSKYLGFDPIGDYNNHFLGTLNGNGYTVDGLIINRPANPLPNRTGLFGMTGSGSRIENIGLTNINITGGVSTGGLVGQNYEGAIVNSYTTGFLYAPYVSGYNPPFNAFRAGGFVGTNDHGTITNCYSEVTVEGNNYMGGFVGGNSAGTISKCYATGSVIANDYAGGFAGTNNGTISDSYAWGDVDAAYAAGGFAGENAGTIQNSYSIGAVDPPATSGGFIGVSYPGSTYTANFWDTETSGMTDGIGSGDPSSEVTGKITREMKRIETFNPGDPSGTSSWNFTITGVAPEDGGGVWIMAGYPHLQMEHKLEISDAIHLQMMALDLDASYQILSDIDASDTAAWGWDPSMGVYRGFDPIGSDTAPFSSDFSGSDNSITNLHINSNSRQYVGLFGYIIGDISDIHIVDSNISGTGVDGADGIDRSSPWPPYAGDGEDGSGIYVGALAGYIEGDITDSSVTGAGTVSGTAGAAGRGGNITAGYSGASAYGGDGGDGGTCYVGGLAGFNQTGTISNSYTTINISGTGGTGGAGGDASNHDNAYAGLAGTGGNSYTGGLTGWNQSGTVNGSYSTSEVNGEGGTGGAGGLGSCTGSQYGYSSDGGVGGDSFTGGLAGLNQSGVINNDSYASGHITGTGGAGGRGGDAGARTDSKAGGAGGTSYTGGIVGFDDSGTIENVHYDTETVTGTGGAGGNGGDGNHGDNPYNIGGDAGDCYVGGIAGWSQSGSILNSDSFGTLIEGVGGVGGNGGTNLIGRQGGAGGDVYAGGIAGHNSSTITDSNNTTDVSAAGGTGGRGGLGWDRGEPGGDGGDVYVGGFAGSNASANITSSSNTGNLTGVAGTGGRGSDMYRYAYTVNRAGDGGRGGTSYVGGFAGTDDSGYFSNCENTGDVSSTGGSGGNGGLDSSARGGSGGDGGTSCAGGFLGLLGGPTAIEKSYSLAVVTAEGGSGGSGSNPGSGWPGYGGHGGDGGVVYAGGLIGIGLGNLSSISDSYGLLNTRGTGGSGGRGVSGGDGGSGGNSHVGGFIGYNSGVTISRSYSIGYPESIGGAAGSGSPAGTPGTSFSGGFGGYDVAGIYNSCFWDTGTSGTTNAVDPASPFPPSGITGASTVQMMSRMAFEAGGWDFTSTWEIVETQRETYPYHQWKYPSGAHGLSGTLYDASTELGPNLDVVLVVNASESYAMSTYANGFYYLLLDNAQLEANDLILTYINDDPTYKGNAVSVTGSGGINLDNNLDIYNGGVTATHENAGPLTIADFAAAYVPGEYPGDLLFTMDGPVLKVDGDFRIMDSKTFAPEADMEVAGSWLNGDLGIFSPEEGTRVTFTGEGTIDPGSTGGGDNAFEYLRIEASGVYTLDDNLRVEKDMSLVGGELGSGDSTPQIGVGGDFIIATATFTGGADGGDITIGNDLIVDYLAVFNGSPRIGAGLEVGGDLAINGHSSTFNTPGGEVVITGSLNYAPLSSPSTLDASNSSRLEVGDGIDIYENGRFVGASENYITGDVLVDGAGAEFNGGGAMEVAGNASFNSGSATMPSGDFSVEGDLFISPDLSSFDHNDGRIDAAGSGSQAFDTGGYALHNFVHSGSGTLLLDNYDLEVESYTPSGSGTLDFNSSQSRQLISDGTLYINTAFRVVNNPYIRAASFDFGQDTQAGTSGHLFAMQSNSVTLLAAKEDPFDPTGPPIFGQILCDVLGPAITAPVRVNLTASSIGTASNPLVIHGPMHAALTLDVDANGLNPLYPGEAHISHVGDVIIADFNATADSSIVAHSDLTWNFDAALGGFDLTLSASENVNMNGDLAMTDGSLFLTADNNDNGVGAYLQDFANDKKISTINTGDITLVSGSASEVGDVDCAGNLSFNSSAGQASNYNINSELDVEGDVTIGNNTTVTANDSEWEVGRNWTNNGTFNAGTSEVTFDTLATSNISGFTTFNDFVSETAGKTILFQTGNILNPAEQQVVTGIFKVKGVSGNQITLNRQGATGRWNINPQGSTDVANLIVSNSNNNNGNPIFSWGSYKGSREGVAGTTYMWFEGPPDPVIVVPPVDPSITPVVAPTEITGTDVTSLGDTRQFVNVGKEYGLDLIKVDGEIKYNMPYIEWYVPAIYVSRIYIENGTSIITPYDVNGPTGESERLSQGDEFMDEKTVTSTKDEVAFTQEEGEPGEVIGVRGKVIIVDAAGEVSLRTRESRVWVPAKGGTELSDGDVIKTGKDGHAVIKIVSDGFESVMNVKPEGTILFMGLLIRSNNPDQALIVDMPIGEAKLNTQIKDLTKGELQVKTPSFLVKVREGELYISTYAKDNPYKKIYAAGKYVTNVACFEGSIYIMPYDEEGIKWDKGVVISGGQKKSITGEIKET